MEKRSRNVKGFDSNPLGRLLLTTAMPWAFFVAATSALALPEGGDGRGFFVKLELPWTTLKVGERLIFRYTLENASHKPAVVAIPLAEDGFGWPAGGQPYLEAKWQNGRSSEKSDYDIRKAVWPPKGLEGNEPQAWGELPPGQKITWSQNQLPPEYFGVRCYEGLEAIQAHWLVGPSRWISSEPVPVKMVSVPKSDCIDVFEDHWSSYGLGKDSFSGTATVIPIDRRHFLFWNRMRVTEVAPEDEFEHQIDKDGTNLEITITGSTGTRKVYYHLRHGIVRDTPWPIGPVSLFSPQPEPIPPAELEALRKKMAEAKDNDGTGRSISSPATPNPKGGPLSLDSRHKVTVFWPWIAGGVALLIAFSASMVIRAKRNISISGQ